MKFLSARAGAAQCSSVFNCFGKGGTDQKDTEHILQHFKSRSVFSLHYFRKTFSTPFCIELTIASTFSTLLIKSKSSMSWLTEPFDCFLPPGGQGWIPLPFFSVTPRIKNYDNETWRVDSMSKNVSFDFRNMR